MQRYVGQNRSSLDSLYMQIASGKKYLRRSEDPVANDNIAVTKAGIEQTEQWGRNLELAANWEMASEAKLTEMVETMQRVNELVVEANNGVLNKNDRQNIAIEINSIIEVLVTQMNASYSGTAMFAGMGLRPTGQTGRWNDATMGTKPAPGGVAWEDLSQAQYAAWQTEQLTDNGTPGTVAGTTLTAPDSPPKDWSGFNLEGARVRITAGPAAGTYGVIKSNTGDTVTVEGWNGSVIPAGAVSYEIIDFEPGWIEPDGSAFTSTRDSNGEIITVTYNGSANRRQMQAFENATTIKYGTIGDQLVNFASKEFDPATSTWVDVNVNLFDSLIRLRDDLQKGVISDELYLERISRSVNNVINRDVENAVSQTNIASLLKTTNSNYESNLVRLSGLEDVDVAAAISELNEMEAALTASLQMIPRMNNLRLIDFI
jgi:flagellin-like hook-associated protein FlgL